MTDLVTKAKQIEVLIQSLPVPESEEDQVRGTTYPSIHGLIPFHHLGEKVPGA